MIKKVIIFRSLVKSSYPTEYCNDYWNKIPCCANCNSSKGGKTFEEWFDCNSQRSPFLNMKIDKKEKIKNKFLKYHEEFEKRHQKKFISEDKIKLLIENDKQYLKILQENVNIIKNETTY